MHVAEMDPIQALMAILHCLLSAMWAGPAAEENPLGVQHRHCTQVPGGTEGKEKGPYCTDQLFCLSVSVEPVVVLLIGAFIDGGDWIRVNDD